MQAVILAGGLGTRLRPLTEQMPKVMVPINGKPFILYLMEWLKSHGISDIVLCTGWLGQKIKDFLADGNNYGIRIRYSEEKEELLGTAGALRQARELLDEYFLVINGDTYLPVDYRALETAFRRRGKKALMVVYDNRDDTSTSSNVELDDDMMVVRHAKGSTDDGLKYIDAGTLVLMKETLNLTEERVPVSLEEGLYPALIRQGELAAYITRQRFFDIGTPEKISAFEKFLKGALA